jgi:hypothetical protein
MPVHTDEREEETAPDVVATGEPGTTDDPPALSQEESESAVARTSPGRSSSARGPLRRVTKRDLGVPDYLCVDEYLPLGLAYYIISGAFSCFEAVTGVARGIGLDGKHFHVLLYDDGLAPDLPARLREFLPACFEHVEDEVVYVPLPYCELEEQTWEWETHLSERVPVKDPISGTPKFFPSKGTVGWIAQNGHGVTARHVVYPSNEVGFAERANWQERETMSFFSPESRQRQPHPASCDVDLAIVNVGGFLAEDSRDAWLFPGKESDGITEEMLLEKVKPSSLLDIQGRVIPKELRTLDAFDAAGRPVALQNLLVGAKLMITYSDTTDSEPISVQDLALVRLGKPRDPLNADDMYSPHTTRGDSGAALSITEPTLGDSTIVIGFLRGMLTTPRIGRVVGIAGDESRELRIVERQQDSFRVFTMANCSYLDYFQNEYRHGVVFKVMSKAHTCPLM